MKLFAVAVTTAVTARRVDSPAPGFVNEQGGYWADQTSDQSQHYPQPPQPSFQGQQGQKPQCAEGYNFKPPGKLEAVFMEKVGENDEKPFYSGWFDGEEKFLYWAWDRQSNPTNAVVQAVPGNWFFGSTVGDVVNAISSSTTYGLRHCPTDQQVQWVKADTTFDTFVSMEATHGNYNSNHQNFPCCQVYEWTYAESEEPVMMTRDWNKSASDRYYYTTFFNGAEHYMYFQFDLVDNFRADRFGRWYIGEKLDDPDSALFYTIDNRNSVPFPAYQSCPNAPFVGGNLWLHKQENKPMKESFKLKCADSENHWRKREPVTTCASKKSEKNYFFEKDVDKCKFDMVVQELVKTQVAQLLVFRPDAENLNLMQWPNDMAQIIRDMTRNRCITTIDSNQHRVGSYIQDCSGLCNVIKDIEGPTDMGDVSKWIVETYFRSITSWENFDIWQREACLKSFTNLLQKNQVLAPLTGYAYAGGSF